MALPPGKRTNNCSGLGPGQKKWQHRGNQPNRCCLLASGICYTSSSSSCIPVRDSPKPICSGYEARVAATPVTIVRAKIITMPAWTKNDPVTAGSGSAADAKHSPMNPIPINVLPNLRIMLTPFQCTPMHFHTHDPNLKPHQSQPSNQLNFLPRD